MSFLRQRVLTVFVLAGLALGVGFWVLGENSVLAVTAFVVIGIVIVVTAVDLLRDLMAGHWRAGHFGRDRHGGDSGRRRVYGQPHHRSHAHPRCT